MNLYIQGMFFGHNGDVSIINTIINGRFQLMLITTYIRYGNTYYYEHIEILHYNILIMTFYVYCGRLL